MKNIHFRNKIPVAHDFIDTWTNQSAATQPCSAAVNPVFLASDGKTTKFLAIPLTVINKAYRVKEELHMQWPTKMMYET